MIPDELLNCTPPLPTQKELKEFCEWEELFFTWRNENGEKLGYCTACGETINLELGKIYTEEQIQNLYRKHNEYGKCPNCGNTVRWKDRNRGRKYLIQENYLYYIQHLRNGGLLLRTMYLFRDFSGIVKNVKIEILEHQRIYYAYNKCDRFERIPRYSFNSTDWYKMSTINTPSPNNGNYYKGGEFIVISPKIYKKDDFNTKK